MFQTIFKIPIDTKESLIIVAFLGFLGAILVNLKSIYELFDIFSRRKLSILKESLNDGKVTEPIKEVLQEQVDQILFGHATGIKDYKNLREKIIELYKYANGRLTYLDFKRAYSFLMLRADGRLEIRKIERMDWLKWVFSWIISIFFLLACVFLMALIIFFPIQKTNQLILLMYTFYFFGIALATLTQTQLIPTAQKIKHEIRLREKNFWEKQYFQKVLSEKEVIKSTNITEELQLDLINDLFVLKPATDVNLHNLETAVQDMREERINKFTSW